MRNLINIINEAGVGLSYERHGLPTDISDPADIQKEIAAGDLKPDSLVTMYRQRGQRPVLAPASDVPEINQFFGAPEGHKTAVAKTGTKRIRVTRALERIFGAKLGTEHGAQDMLAALADLCDSVIEWVKGRGEIEIAMKKAVMNAKAMFPQDAKMAMTNRSVPRNIKDGLQMIRDELKNYKVVLETDDEECKDVITESTGLECMFFETQGKWFYALETHGGNEWDWREDARAYGPFKSFDDAYGHLHANHANPGGFSQVEFGDKPLDATVQALIAGAEDPKAIQFQDFKTFRFSGNRGQYPNGM